MGSSKQRGAKVIYVAASARELPQDAQDWLSHAGNRAVPSPNIYDALALLATGRKPVAMIVSMEAVDWSEMEFFDHAARLSGDTTLYVTGSEHQTTKLQAACSRGAQPFDGDALGEQLTTLVDYRSAGAGGLLAGSLRPGGLRAAPPPQPPPSPEPPIVITEEETTLPPEPDDRPVVRLVTAPEPEETAAPAVPFPWSPSPNRPQRTPPKVAQQPQPVESGDTQAETESPPPAPRRSPAPVKLTQEELAALLGRAPRSTGSGQERFP
jgi:hypothetical protein